MKVTVTEGRHKSGRQYWLVRTWFPGRNRPDRRFFSDFQEMKRFVAARERESVEAAQIPEKLKLEAAEYTRLLAPHGWDLRRATDYVLQNVIPFETKPPVAAAADEYIAAESQVGHAKCTVTTLRSRLRHFTTRFGNRHLHELTVADIEIWRDALQDAGVPALTIRHLLGAASGFFHWATSKKYCDSNPLEHVRRPKYVPARPAIFPVEHVGKLFRIAPKHDLLAWVVLGTLCGVRPSELEAFNPAGIQLDERVIIIDDANSRGGDRRVIELDDAWGDCVIAWLQTCDLTKPILPQPWRRHVEALRRELGLWSADIMRHTAASAHYAFFQDQGKTMKMLGHTGKPDIFHNHYKALLKRAEAATLYALRPS